MRSWPNGCSASCLLALGRSFSKHFSDACHPLQPLTERCAVSWSRKAKRIVHIRFVGLDQRRNDGGPKARDTVTRRAGLLQRISNSWNSHQKLANDQIAMYPCNNMQVNVTRC